MESKDYWTLTFFSIGAVVMWVISVKFDRDPLNIGFLIFGYYGAHIFLAMAKGHRAIIGFFATFLPGIGFIALLLL